MRIHNIQISPPEADRKVMLWVSIVLMILFWIFSGTVVACYGYAAYTDGSFAWDTERFVVMVCCSAVNLAVIPRQLARYIRELRGSR